ncbi:MAG: helicase-related protein, partial [Myxococcota bacterium]
RVRDALGCPPTLALTATAPPEVQNDIRETLGIPAAPRVVRGFDRTNLLLEVQETSGKKEKDELLPELVATSPALVYAATRKSVQRATEALRRAGVRAGMYHAGMTPQDRTRVQEDFMAGKVPVVVATNAFGMGVDKSDIRTIVHYEMPGTVEAYYQEIGRAGRDGRPSRAVLLYHGSDRRIQQFFIDTSHPPVEWIEALYEGLRSEDQNPVFATLEDLAEHLPPEANPRAVSSCLTILRREGLVRRISPHEQLGSVVREALAPTSAPKGDRGRVWQAVCEMAPKPRFPYSLSPEELCRTLRLERDQVNAALRGLEERGYLRYTAPDRNGGVELLTPHQPLTLDAEGLRERRSREFAKLDRMVAYTTAPCRRRYIIEHFGEASPFSQCGTCDGCRAGAVAKPEKRALTPDEQKTILKLLSCMARMQRKTDQAAWSRDLICKTVLGSTEARVRQWGFDLISTWGLLGTRAEGARWTAKEVGDLLDALVEAGCVTCDWTTRNVAGKQRSYRQYELSEGGWAALRGGAGALEVAFPHAHKLVRRRPVANPGGPAPTGLVDALREARKLLATQADVPPYVVASNRTLDDMARLRPLTKRAMLGVHGMGEVRYARFGGHFLEVIRRWASEGG